MNPLDTEFEPWTCIITGYPTDNRDKITYFFEFWVTFLRNLRYSGISCFVICSEIENLSLFHLLLRSGENMSNTLKILLILSLFLICIEAQCKCKLNKSQRKVKVIVDKCSYGFLPKIRILKKSNGLQIMRHCKCFCVHDIKAYKHHHSSDFWSRIAWNTFVLPRNWFVLENFDNAKLWKNAWPFMQTKMVAISEPFSTVLWVNFSSFSFLEISKAG